MFLYLHGGESIDRFTRITTARRAWLFADTTKGVRANAVLYTLVESAKANNLDVIEYLKYLLDEMPSNDHLQQPELLDQYLHGQKNCRTDASLH